MIRTHLKTLIFTSILTLLPIPVGLMLWDRFPADVMPSQFFTVWLPPLSMLVAQWICVLFTSLDPGNENRNRKVQNLVLWILPVTCWFCSGFMYALYLDYEIPTVFWMMILFGILFAAIGNYLPKTRMNSTIGIKVSWAYTSEENWNATHRFAGRLWVVGGLLLIPSAFLPEGAAIVVMIVMMVVLCIVPTVYSWQFWKKQKAEGADLKDLRQTNPKLTKISLLFLAGILVFTLAVMFVGDLEYTFSENRFFIEADWYSDMTIRYETIESIELRNENVPGVRVGGFGSLRLLMGHFKNAEFGTHIRYTYYKTESCIILKTENQTFVFSGKDNTETRVLYDTLLSKVG